MRQYPGYIFDLDGTIYRGHTLVPGADETIRRLRARGARIVFVSNNPARSRVAYAQKLSALGIPATPEDVVNSSGVLIQELRREAPHARLYVIGEPAFREEMRQAGLTLVEDPAQTEIVVLAFDRTFHYGKLLGAHLALKRGARVWATNPDATCPTADGDTPDCGLYIAAIERLTGRPIDRMTGKPSAAMIAAAARQLGMPPADCLIVGDRLDTDIRMAQNAGCASAVVLTGVTSRETLRAAPRPPDYVLESVAQLP